jgi:hypothetical protein
MRPRFRNRARQRRDGWGLPDPHKPGSPDYAERAQQTATQLPCGTVRIDAGEPVARLAEEPQPVACGSPSARPAVPVVAPAPAPAAPSAERREPDTKAGLGKHRRPD